MSHTSPYLLGLVLLVSAAPAQDEGLPTADYRIERQATRYRFERDGSGERVESARVHLLTPAALQTFGQLVFPFQGETERTSIELLDVLAGGVRKASVADAAIVEVASPVVAEFATYTDQREVHVVVPKLVPGDVLEYRVRTSMVRSLAPGDFWLEHRWSADDVDEEILEVEIPAAMGIALEDRTGGEHEDVIENGKRRLRWRHAESRAASDDDDADEIDDDEWRAPDVELSSFETWDALASWYSKLQFPQQSGVASERVRQVVAANTGDRDPVDRDPVDRDPVEALFHFVRREIRYVSLSFGIGRYQPHRAAEVLDHAHGDCKDKHTLLAALLGEAGVTAYPALVSTFREPDLDVPSPAQFDHVITAIVDGAGYRFVDATNPGNPLGLLPAEIRGRNALIVTPDGAARWVRLPEEVPFETWSKVTIEGSLEGNGRIQGRGVCTFRGDSEVLMRELLATAPADSGLAGMLLTMGFGGKASAISTGDPLDTRQPLVVSFDYVREGSPLRRGAKIGLPSLMVGFSLGSIVNAGSGPLEGVQDRNEIELVLALPDGVEVDLPVPVRVERPFGAYTATYELEGRTFRARRSLTWKTHELASADEGARKAFVSTVMSDGAQGPRVREAALSLAAPESFDVAELERSAVALLTKGLGAEALRELERITAAQPDHPRAWAMTSAAHLMEGDADAALNAARRQLEVNPEAADVYRHIGAAHMFAGRVDEAIAAFEQQVARSPLDGKTYGALGMALLKAERVTEAVDALTKAVAISPESPEANVALASALLRAGRREEGLARVRDLESIDNVDLLVGLATQTLRIGETDLTRRLLLRAVDRKPEHPMAWFLLGALALTEGDIETATRHLNRHLELYPGDSKATAMLQMARGDLRDDLRSSSQIDALTGTPEGRALTYVQNGSLHFRAGRKTEALASFEQALASSDAATVKAAVAFHLAHFRLDEKRAGLLADAALSELVDAVEALDTASDAAVVDRLLKDLAATWATIGMVAFMNLDLEVAKPYLSAAILWMPNAEMAELLATIYEFEKDLPTAKRYFAIALAAEGRPHTARQSLDRLVAKDESVEELVRREWTAHRGRLEVRQERPLGATGVTQALVRLTSSGVIEDVRLLAPSRALEPLILALRGSRFEVESPERSPARLVARAEIDCMSSEGSCVTRLLAPAVRF